ncbi:MAG: chromate transporter [Bacteroidales bacterium]|nr:chromate transporter [Bacteroidales bacterium]
MKLLLQLFYSFFKIGAFTIGGGYAMIPLMEKELVDRRQWIDKEDFMDTMAVAQAMPGIFAVNMATQIGQRLRGLRGAIVAVLGNILVPILIIIGLAIFFHQLRGNAVVEAIFKGVRPAVVALIAVPVFTLARTAKVSWRNCWIPIGAALLIYLLGVSPTWIVLAAIAGGVLYGYSKNRKEGTL